MPAREHCQNHVALPASKPFANSIIHLKTTTPKQQKHMRLKAGVRCDFIALTALSRNRKEMQRCLLRCSFHAGSQCGHTGSQCGHFSSRRGCRRRLWGFVWTLPLTLGGIITGDMITPDVLRLLTFVDSPGHLPCHSHHLGKAQKHIRCMCIGK